MIRARRQPHTTSHARRATICALALALGLAAAPAAQAQADLADTGLEELMTMGVTSVARRPQALNDAAAAIHVITADDIRRSGATRLTQVLALAPGVEVAHVSGAITAVTVRGFNQQIANKLLVLVDGRSVYTQAFSGVYWDMQNLMLEDIERIEVIRGPGSTLWGSNAVNGVINIITRSARDTIGGFGTIATGVEERTHAGLRYGWRMGEYGAMRVYAKREGYDASVTLDGRGAGDAFRSERIGLRGDWDLPHGDRITLAADHYRGGVGVAYQPTPTVPASRLLSPSGSFQGAFVLGRWQRALSLGSDVSVQLYHETFTRDEYSRIEDRTTDIELQHRTPVGDTQDLVWGVNWRHRVDASTSSRFDVFAPATADQSMFSIYGQNETRLLQGKVRLIVGARIENSYWNRWELQPTLRAIGAPDERTRVWASYSRAARTPSRLDRDAAARLPALGVTPGVAIHGNPEFRSERVDTFELGWRRRIGSQLGLDATVFHSRYDRLRTLRNWVTFSPFTANVQFTNAMEGSTSGAELSALWTVSPRWRLVGNLTLFNAALHDLDAPGSDAEGWAKGASPSTQAGVSSYVDLGQGWSLDTRLAYVGALRRPNNESLVPDARVDSYIDATVRVGWRVDRHLELALVGRNLAAARRLEFVSELGAGVTLNQRSVYLKASYAF